MIDMNKKYRTRDGREVRIYAVDGADDRTVHGAVKGKYGWAAFQWKADGAFDNDQETHFDLIEVKPERWYPVVVSDTQCDPFIPRISFDTKEAALAYSIAMTGYKTIDAWRFPE